MKNYDEIVAKYQELLVARQEIEAGGKLNKENKIAIEALNKAIEIVGWILEVNEL